VGVTPKRSVRGAKGEQSQGQAGDLPVLRDRLAWSRSCPVRAPPARGGYRCSAWRAARPGHAALASRARTCSSSSSPALSRSARSASREAPPTFPVAQCHPVDGRNVEAGLHPVRCDWSLEAPVSRRPRCFVEPVPAATHLHLAGTGAICGRSRRSRQERQCINIRPAAWLVGSGRVDQPRDELLITRADPPICASESVLEYRMCHVQSRVFCAC
jgi:hypothetical protein